MDDDVGDWWAVINMRFTIISCRISTYTHYLQHRHVWACTGTCTQGRAYISAYFEINMCVWVASSIGPSSSTYSRPTGLRSKSKELPKMLSFNTVLVSGSYPSCYVILPSLFCFVFGPHTVHHRGWILLRSHINILLPGQWHYQSLEMQQTQDDWTTGQTVQLVYSIPRSPSRI